MRVGIALLGAFLLFLGLSKVFWEMYSWGILSELGERPPLVGKDPRVRYIEFIVTAAVGAAMVVAAVIPW